MISPRKSLSDLEVLNRIAEFARRGRPMPLGEIGRDLECFCADGGQPGAGGCCRHCLAPIQRAGHPRGRAPAELQLASGLLDDHRKALARSSKFYMLFGDAWRFQDTWSDTEHESFWMGALAHWPKGSAGKYSHTEALAYAIVLAVEAGADLPVFLKALSVELGRRPRPRGLTAKGFPLRSLQSRDVLRMAVQMLHQPRHLYLQRPGRLPRVVSASQAKCVPWLAVTQIPLEAHSKAGDASLEIVRAARLVAERLKAEPLTPA